MAIVSNRLPTLYCFIVAQGFHAGPLLAAQVIHILHQSFTSSVRCFLVFQMPSRGPIVQLLRNLAHFALGDYELHVISISMKKNHHQRYQNLILNDTTLEILKCGEINLIKYPI